MNRLKKIIQFIVTHPLGRRHKIISIYSFFWWQLRQLFFPSEKVMNFLNGIKMSVKKNETGVTGNIYVGIHDFYELSFALHYLRETDVFADIGANVGFYSVVLSKSIGIKSFAFEPVPVTFEKLKENVNLNALSDLVVAVNAAVGSLKGTLKMSSNFDTVNHVVISDSENNNEILVDVIKSDTFFSTYGFPNLIKIDVEGFETEVVEGMKEILASVDLKVIIIELNGSGGRYGFDENIIHQKLLSHSFKPFSYDPFERTVLEMESYGTTNTIYIRDIDFVKIRLKAGKSFKVFGESI